MPEPTTIGRYLLDQALPEPYREPPSGTSSDNDFNVLTAKNCILMNVQFACNVSNYVISENGQIQGTELEVSRLNN